MPDNNLDLKVMMTWQWVLTMHEGHIEGKFRLIELTDPIGPRGRLHKTFQEQFPKVSSFLDKALKDLRSSNPQIPTRPPEVPQGAGGTDSQNTHLCSSQRLPA